MERVIAYIDGYNLYHGIKAAKLKKFYWLNVSEMCRSLLTPNQQLNYTHYFTSRVSRPPATVKRQTTFIEALQTLPNLKVHEGQYDGELFQCSKCGHPDTWHNEKMTDVNIALEMVKDAIADKYDVALLVTGDADQTPAVRYVQGQFPSKRVICAFPPKRVSKWLRQTAKGHVHINYHVLSGSQLPPSVVKEHGYVLRRPIEWQ